MFKHLGIFAAMLVAAMLIGSWASADDDEKKSPKKKRTFASVGMKIKLDFAKEMLSGLATGDHRQIRENAKAMQGLNAIEQFARGGTPGYQAQLKVFQFATNELVQAADEKNLDRATLAYTQMTISCVNCHKELRK